MLVSVIDSTGLRVRLPSARTIRDGAAGSTLTALPGMAVGDATVVRLPSAPMCTIFVLPVAERESPLIVSNVTRPPGSFARALRTVAVLYREAGSVVTGTAVGAAWRSA